MSRKARKSRKPAVALALSGALALSVIANPIALADPAPASQAPAPLPTTAQGLLDRLSETSRQAEETTENAKGLEDKIKEANAVLDRANHDADAKTQLARQAQGNASSIQEKVNSISQSRYRRVSIDPTTAYIGAKNPQEAIDRYSYMNALAADTRKTIDDLQAQLSTADKARDEAERAKAVAKFTAGQLEQQKSDLEKKQEELKAQTAEIEKAVNNLSPAEKAKWIAKNGPIKLSSDDVAAASGAANGVVAAALSKLGAPYSWGAAGPNEFDCSGLVYWAYKQIGKTLPRTSQAQMAGGTPVSMDQLQPGDVIGYYPGATHVGIYIGNGRLVHASDYGIPLQVVNVNSMPVYGARRY